MIQNVNQYDFEICQIHREKIVYIDKEQSDLSKRALCNLCVAEQEKNRNLKMIDNIKSQLYNLIEQLTQNRDTKTYQNITVLKDLHNFLHQQQGKFCHQIEKCQQNIINQISLLQEANLQYKNKINLITVHDLNSPDKIKSQLKKEIIDCKGVQDYLIKQINAFEVFQLKQLFEEKIQKIDFGDQNLELEQLCDLELVNNEQQQKVNWKCDQHLEDIMFIDLGYQQTIPNRLACRKCVPNYNIQFTNVEDLQILWRKYEQDTEKQVQIYLNFQKKINNQIMKIIRQLKIEINTQIDGLIQLYQKSLQFNIYDSLYKPFTLLQKDWQTISKDEIIIIADQISQKNRDQIIKLNVRNEFKHKEQFQKNTIVTNLQKILNLINASLSEIQNTNPKENILDLQNKNIYQIRRPKNNSFLGPATTRNEKVLTENSPTIKREFNFESNRDSFELEFINQDSPLKKTISKMKSSFRQNWVKRLQKSLQYQIINQIDENLSTLSVAINSQSSILVLGQYWGEIKVFSFNDGTLKLIQVLQEHTLNVKCLYFMKESSSFLSGSNDKSIIIWEEDLDNKWYSKQKLIGHQGQVQCLIMNHQENLIISGSQDKTIRFWVKESEWQCQQILSAHENSVRSISLNKVEDQLISCAENELKILIIQLQYDSKTWAIVNEINVDYCGSGLLFINENMFAYQPSSIDQLYLFKQHRSQKNQYVFKQQIKIETGDICTSLFPLMFIKSQSILMTKNGRYINIIRKDKYDEYIVEQTFENVSNCCGIKGTLTSDGEFLIIWDGKFNKITVRKLKEY
ncbi:unnamed protein product [Paramecium primaurelia]|uniref:WD domain, G-beta repeat protein n=1 Tax=Paramecium primaurelia TaxID=5886 RepID=A0A8S1PEZ9_PARPR|nr:unnamed protein product [Paramecium primaurelia]